MAEPIHRRPEEVFRSRLERRLDRKAIPEETKRKLIDILRIRKGILTQEELKVVKQKVLSSDTIVFEHLTDFAFLDSILRNGIHASEYDETSVSGLGSNYGMGHRTFAAELYDVFKGYSGSYPTKIIGFGATGEVKSKTEFVKTIFSDLSASLYEHSGKNLSYRDFLFNKSIDNSNFKYFSDSERSFIFSYYKLFKSGKLSFLGDEIIINKIHEYFCRAVARLKYFSFDTSSGKLGAAMNVGLLFASHNVIDGDILRGSLIAAKAKPIGLFCSNSGNLNEVLHIMFANAKSIDDIVPIYGNEGKLLWPLWFKLL